jgi:DNA-binding MarR family transcriptional regulator
MPLNAPADPGTPPDPAASARSNCTCGSLRRASRRVSQFYDSALAPLGIKSTQYSILTEVERHGATGAVTLCALAAAMVMDRSTLGHNLRPLQRDELLVLRSADDDRRKRRIELTRKGRTILQRGRVLWRRAEDRIEAVFGRQPSAELRAVLLNIAYSRELDAALP